MNNTHTFKAEKELIKQVNFIRSKMGYSNISELIQVADTKHPSMEILGNELILVINEYFQSLNKIEYFKMS